MKTDNKKLTDKELKKRLEDLRLKKICASGKFIHSKEKPENFSKIRKEIAKILTEQRRRK